jgi:nucleotide-binding universal stress UspA family protein
MLQTILVPTDGSEHANKAVDLAADLAGKYDGRMVILHILLRHSSAVELREIAQELGAPDALLRRLAKVEDAYAETAMAAYGPVPLMVPDKVLIEVGELIAEAAEKRAKAKGAKDFTIRVTDGVPAEVILKAADHEGADAIVMGSRGLGNLTGMLMGSVSHKVANHAEATCIAVK